MYIFEILRSKAVWYRHICKHPCMMLLHTHDVNRRDSSQFNSKLYWSYTNYLWWYFVIYCLSAAVSFNLLTSAVFEVFCCSFSFVLTVSDLKLNRTCCCFCAAVLLCVSRRQRYIKFWVYNMKVSKRSQRTREVVDPNFTPGSTRISTISRGSRTKRPGQTADYYSSSLCWTSFWMV